MDILSEDEIGNLVNSSKLAKKYNQITDSDSAYEMLSAKLEEAAGKAEKEAAEKEAARTEKAKSSGGRTKEDKSVLEEMLDSSAARQVGRTAASVITRTLLGALGLGGRTTRKKSLW
jgi:hypothetical protein